MTHAGLARSPGLSPSSYWGQTGPGANVNGDTKGRCRTRATLRCWAGGGPVAAHNKGPSVVCVCPPPHRPPPPWGER